MAVAVPVLWLLKECNTTLILAIKEAISIRDSLFLLAEVTNLFQNINTGFATLYRVWSA